MVLSIGFPRVCQWRYTWRERKSWTWTTTKFRGNSRRCTDLQLASGPVWHPSPRPWSNPRYTVSGAAYSPGPELCPTRKPSYSGGSRILSGRCNSTAEWSGFPGPHPDSQMTSAGKPPLLGQAVRVAAVRPSLPEVPHLVLEIPVVQLCRLSPRSMSFPC